MTILTEQSLEFAREHIEKFYDSDFFPKPPEFLALWHQWSDVKKELMSKNVPKLWVTSPRAMTIAKPKAGFRVVHQLEPLDSLVYSALACHVAEGVEAARMPPELHVACSYRFQIADGSYFAGGSGWTNFTSKTEELATKFSHILVTDITDFYNQIYLHRLNNGIEAADPALKPTADDIETFLSMLNEKASQGVPVGPAASIVMAEAVLIDVDTFLRDQGVPHTRYVDDFRVFSNSPRELQQVLERLTLYLYQNHRLTLSSDKTLVMKAKTYVKEYLHSTYTEEKIKLLETLEVFNPYTDEIEQIQIEIDDDAEIQKAQLQAAIEKVLAYEHLDLGLARSVIRTARRHKISAIAEHLLQNFEFFIPVVNDVALYLQEVTDVELAKSLLPHLESIVDFGTLDSQLVRFWMEWHVAQQATYMGAPKLHGLVFGGSNIENQALAAITTKNIAWVRNHKAGVYNLGGWARRAILNASRVLPSDEREHWLKLFINNSPVILDRWVAKWVLETA
ncbi:RNA-directed DNA polymerase [Tahibacter amnicola]|uniref:RNA-directed DNA polymerase n=1 Tax=Tahibacter amnicola TaxID=2976241 RepID=A0ABY6B923_9GAMM|nr:RNA-directed DNA polymerase [Tahibacter amnicola]UXI66031.1 RNA-directed DNA polymerase [Tahibacter amnicola]